MKNDQYIPHEVSTRANSQVINLIESEGCAGYGTLHHTLCMRMYT